MNPLLFNEDARKRMIDHFLDTYNQYMALYDLLQDQHFKQQADFALRLVKRLSTP